MSKSSWTLVVSVAFAIVTAVTKIPDRWQHLVLFVSWTALIFSFLGWLFAHWTQAKRLREAAGRSVMTLVIVGIISGAIGIAVWLLAEPKDEIKLPDPVIEISYRPGIEEFKWLPLVVEPKTRITILIVRKDRTVETWHHENKGETKYFWPRKDFGAPEQIGIIHVSNRGTVAAFDVVIALKLILGSDDLPEGTVRVREELPPIDLPVGGKPHDVYVVGQYHLGGIIRFPDKATMQVQGENVRREITLNRRKLDLVDKIPAIIFPPTRDWWSQDNTGGSPRAEKKSK